MMPRLLALLCLITDVGSAESLTIEAATERALARHPSIVRSRAEVRAADARRMQARGPLLPRLVATGSYQRTTANFAPRPGTVPSSFIAGGASSWESFNFFGLGVTLTQRVWDFGQSTGQWRAASALASAADSDLEAVRQGVVRTVRTAYRDAQARRALVNVARETLENEQRHVGQVQGFVEVGTRPDIDLAKARTQEASAEVQLIGAENDHALSRLALAQAMGEEGPPSFDVTDDEAPEVPGEDTLDPSVLIAEALGARPELRAAAQRIAADSASISAARGSFFPAIDASTGITELGPTPADLTWNWNAQVALNWTLFDGLSTAGSVREARANRSVREADDAALRLQVVLEVEQSRLDVRAAKGTRKAAGVAVQNAREQLRLAEGRYLAGTGSIIELADAQVALTSAAAQEVEATYALSAARARLLAALGRP